MLRSCTFHFASHCLALFLVCVAVGERGFAKESGERYIATLDEPTAAWVRGLVHGTRIQVLQPSPDESAADFDRRVLEMRDSVCLVVLTKPDSMLLQMYRERLHNQGVRIVDLSARTSRRFLGNRMPGNRMPASIGQPQPIASQGLSDLTQLMAIEVPSNLYVSQ